MPRHPGPAGRPYRRNREALGLGKDNDGTVICHLCGHPGATQADHGQPRSHGGTDDRSNLFPAHGVDAPCTVCGQACNQARGNQPLTVPTTYRSRNW
jgi:hypothetical protein